MSDRVAIMHRGPDRADRAARARSTSGRRRCSSRTSSAPPTASPAHRRGARRGPLPRRPRRARYARRARRRRARGRATGGRDRAARGHAHRRRHRRRGRWTAPSRTSPTWVPRSSTRSTRVGSAPPPCCLPPMTTIWLHERRRPAVSLRRALGLAGRRDPGPVDGARVTFSLAGRCAAHRPSGCLPRPQPTSPSARASARAGGCRRGADAAPHRPAARAAWARAAALRMRRRRDGGGAGRTRRRRPTGDSSRSSTPPAAPPPSRARGREQPCCEEHGAVASRSGTCWRSEGVGRRWSPPSRTLPASRSPSGSCPRSRPASTPAASARRRGRRRCWSPATAGCGSSTSASTTTAQPVDRAARTLGGLSSAAWTSSSHRALDPDAASAFPSP